MSTVLTCALLFVAATPIARAEIQVIALAIDPSSPSTLYARTGKRRRRLDRGVHRLPHCVVEFPRAALPVAHQSVS